MLGPSPCKANNSSITLSHRRLIISFTDHVLTWLLPLLQNTYPTKGPRTTTVLKMVDPSVPIGTPLLRSFRYMHTTVSRRTLTLVLQCWMMLLTGLIPSPPTALVAYRLTKDRQSYRVIPAEVNFRDHALHFHIQHGSRGQGSAQLLLRSLITDVSNTAG